MADRAHVDSIDALKHFRRALWKFAEAAGSALGDADGEASRTLTWLETEQPSYWEHQIRKRHELVERCKEAVRMKKLFKSPTGHTQSAVEEEKALRIAQRRLEEAHAKLVATKQWARKLQKEIQVYKGSVQRLQTDVSVDVPVAVARLDQMVATLSAYAAYSAPSVAGSEVAGSTTGAAGGPGGASMARAADGTVKPAPASPLRLQTPADAQRQAALPLEAETELVLPPLPPESTALLASFNLDPAGAPPIEAGDRVVLAAACVGRPRIYLERTAPAGGDCGWYVGAAEGLPPTTTPFRATTVSRLLEARPDYAGLLAMPPGCLVVLGPGGIELVLDPSDRRLYPEQTAPTVAPNP